MARLDRLSAVKEVAQIAACIGREFSYELITSISRFPQAVLEEALEQLAASELIFRRGAAAARRRRPIPSSMRSRRILPTRAFCTVAASRCTATLRERSRAASPTLRKRSPSFSRCT